MFLYITPKTVCEHHGTEQEALPGRHRAYSAIFCLPQPSILELTVTKTNVTHSIGLNFLVTSYGLLQQAADVASRQALTTVLLMVPTCKPISLGSISKRSSGTMLDSKTKRTTRRNGSTRERLLPQPVLTVAD